MNICITGGLGFIGSHCCVLLLEKGYNVIIIDNLSNSSYECLDKIYHITGKKPRFYDIDLCNYNKLYNFFYNLTEKIDCVIHCAALKSIHESNNDPLKYYDNNIIGTINLLQCMKMSKCKNIIFSSSATIYSETKSLPIYEDSDIKATNCYDKTKLYIEEILIDLNKAEKDWNIIILRYFNTCGAHPSGKLGEMSKDMPTNLFLYILDVLSGKYEYITIHGNDYNTYDGTCITDYIHIMDLANGHIAAIDKIKDLEDHKTLIINLGTGRGYSVLEIIKEMGIVSGNIIPYVFGKRRLGDCSISFTSIDKAKTELGWKPEKTLRDICVDSLKWKQNILQIKK